jgi:hypothetical protein
MKIYKVVTDRELYELQNKVEELLNNGWELVGGVAVDRSYNYYQALIKEQEQ